MSLDYYQLCKSVVNMLIWEYGLEVVDENSIRITDSRMFLKKLSNELLRELEFEEKCIREDVGE